MEKLKPTAEYLHMIRSAAAKGRWKNHQVKPKRKLTDEERHTIRSEAAKKRWRDNPEYRKRVAAAARDKFNDPAMNGRIHNEHANKLHSERMARRWKDPVFREKMLDTLARTRKRNTSKSCEAFLQKIESHYGIVIEREYELGDYHYDGRYKNVLIECDGHHWHDSDFRRNLDARKAKLATESDFTLIRIPLNRLSEVNRVYEIYKSQLNALDI